MGCRSLGVLVMLTLGLLVVPCGAQAQPASHVARIGYLGYHDIPELGLAAFQQGLRDLGYVEGQNLVVEYRWVQGRWPDPVVQIVTDLIGLGVDVIVTYSTGLVLRVQRVTKTVPIVCAVCADLVGGGAVESLARPGGNATGLTVIGPDLTAKRLEWLQELGVSRVVALHASAATHPVVVRWRQENGLAAQGLGMQVETQEARTWEAVEQSVAAAAARGAAVAFMEQPSYLRDRQRIAALALRHRVPTVFPFREHVDAGGLMSYGANLPTLFRRAATYVDKILNGARPSDLPVEQLRDFELVLNRKTAQALGITFPPTLLVLANEVLQ